MLAFKKIITSPFSRKIGFAGIAGMLSILIFPFFDLEMLAWIAFIPLFVAIQAETPKNAFWLGWITGCIHFLGTLYWVTVTMVLYGGLPRWLSALLLFVLGLYLALYIGTFTMLIRYFQQNMPAFPLIATAPVIWVGLEYLRSFFFLGFPWNSLGYSQYLTPYVTQFADITGVYGVSFLIVLVNAGIYSVLLTATPRMVKLKIAGVAMLCLGVGIGYSLFILAFKPTTTSVNVAVVQGNIDQSIKWSPEHVQEIFETYKRLSKQIVEKRPELIVWPETAVPFVFRYDPVHGTQLVKFVQDLRTPLLFGGIDIIIVPTPERYRSLNTAFLLSPEGELLSKYDKIHLVPFGEYVPYHKLLFFVDKLTTAIGEVQPGNSYQVMPLRGKSFSTIICFEVIFPNLVRKFVDRGAQFLVNITNDAWFGKTAASYQHFAMVTFRAIENRVAVVRAANTGISGFIDPYGRIMAQSDIYVEDAFVQAIPLRNTKTFYTRYGDVFARLCFASVIVWIGYGVVKKRIHRV